jgi:hypothetical protein
VSDAPPTPDNTRGVLKVITPNTTTEEIAALVAVLSAVATPAPPEPHPVSAWSAHRRTLTPSYPHGPRGWRTSSLPH